MNKRYMLATVMALCCAMGARAEGTNLTATSAGAAAGASKVDAGAAAPCKRQYQLDVEGVKALFWLPMNKTEKIDFAALHSRDEKYRPAIRWGEIHVPRVTGEKQIIEFPAVPDINAGDGPFELKAKASSGLPIYYEVEYGPVIVADGKILIRDVPAKARFPLPCRVTAYQIGRRVAPAVAQAAPVSREFRVVMK